MWRSALFFPSCSLLPSSALSRVYLRFRFPSLLAWDTEYGTDGRGGQLLFNSYSLLNGEPSLGHELELGLGPGPVEFSWILGLLCWGRICLTKINKYEFIAAIVHFRLRGVIVYVFIYTHSRILVCVCMCVIKLKANARCDHINKCINCMCVCLCELPLFILKISGIEIRWASKKIVALFCPKSQVPTTHTNTQIHPEVYHIICMYVLEELL